MKFRFTNILLFFLLCFNYMNAQNFTQYVNPFIGTEGDGNTFPGATLPYGLVKLGPDCVELKSNSGYIPGADIQGFSHLHVSGTGGGPKYGNVLLMPRVGKVSCTNYASPHTNEDAKAGYYTTKLTKYDVKVELTTSHSVGFHQYTFPASDSASILIDLGSFLGIPWWPDFSEAQKLVGSEVEIVSDTMIEGYTRVRHGWNEGEAYTVYFCAVFDTPAENFGTWKDTTISSGNKSEFDSGEKTGAYFTYTTKQNQEIKVKVGISFVGRLKARQNILNEIPDWDFNKVAHQASDIWNKNLAVVEVETPSEEIKKVFYTALYHAQLMPADRTGENPLWVSPEPYYDDFYAIWDTYRATNPLLTIINPDRERDIVRSLIDIYQHEGFMPDARSGNETGRTQGGSNCDVLIVDAYLKGLQGIDYEKGLEAMINNAENNPDADARMKGRGGNLLYNQLGYVPSEVERAGCRTVEYAYNDFCIAQLAKAMGKDSIANVYMERSGNWKNIWKPISHLGAKGFIMPRLANGDWDEEYRLKSRFLKDKYPFDVTLGGTWSDFLYEANSWEYSLYVPHDVPGLVEASGGKRAFETRLDTFFTHPFYNITNEPSFLTPCLYSYIGLPSRTADWVRWSIDKYFNASKAGLPGNDDSGSMSAWVAFHSMGFFPNAGQDLYLITAPMFEKVKINLAGGKQFVIITHNLSSKNKYIVSAKLNGKPFNQCWFTHDIIMQGSTLELTMGSKPGNWGRDGTIPSGK